MKKHYIHFLSPGTFMAEESKQEIPSWDTAKAMKMADKINERHGATPYGFYFTTRERGDADFDSKEAKRSAMYYLGGRILTLADVKREMPEKGELIANMEGNDYDKVVINDNSWSWTQPLQNGDTVLDYTPPKKRVA